MRYARPKLPSSLLFQQRMFHSRYSAFQEVQLAPGQWDPMETEQFPLTQGYEVTHPSWQNVPLQILVDNSFPRHNGALCSQQHSTLIHSKSEDNGFLLRLPYLYSIGCLVGIPRLAYTATGPLTHHSNILKPGTVLQPTQPRYFTCQ